MGLRESQAFISQVFAAAHCIVREPAALPCCGPALTGEIMGSLVAFPASWKALSEHLLPQQSGLGRALGAHHSDGSTGKIHGGLLDVMKNNRDISVEFNF